LHNKTICLSDSEIEKTVATAYLRTGALSQSTVKVKVKQSCYRPGVAQRFPGS